jgi:leucyl aminopeptidase
VRGVTITVLDVPAMERLGMGSILSVGKGSARPPRMLIVEYRGAAQRRPVVLAGKGITFDSGGISLKPGAGMWEMKGDMGGAAAVVGTRAQPRQVAGAGERRRHRRAGREHAGRRRHPPGDVVKAMNGKTIEILNTDAEGRLVLADAVAYAERATARPRSSTSRR